MEKKNKKLKRRKGFSLIEMVIVMAIIGILIGIMAPKYKSFVGEAKKIEIKADSKTLSSLIDLYEANNSEIDKNIKVSALTEASLTESKEKNEIVNFVNSLKNKKSSVLEKSLNELDKE